ncbi:zinc-binding dehydrogenase [Granulicella aggregans]|uniref:zinc-binding dehydrogenase n=1 Tax=Granulicella aggregans TaxID=474949 RepID=UPI003D7C3221
MPWVRTKQLYCSATGGVSLFALQFAKAHGSRVIVTSSSDEKLERARALGADETINYRSIPQWADEVFRLTEGRGADLVLETGGTATFLQSIQAAALDWDNLHYRLPERDGRFIQCGFRDGEAHSTAG